MAPEKQLNNDIYVVSSCIIDIYVFDKPNEIIITFWGKYHLVISFIKRFDLVVLSTSFGNHLN
jgi:hypothetical protein